jgi:hypothetical protein
LALEEVAVIKTTAPARNLRLKAKRAREAPAKAEAQEVITLLKFQTRSGLCSFA